MKRPRNEYGQTWYQWACDLFQFENCAECGKGVRGHVPALAPFSTEERIAWFARCKDDHA